MPVRVAPEPRAALGEARSRALPLRALWTPGITSGSLALGFYLMLRDRRTAERQQASLVSATVDRDAHVVHIFNRSDQSIYSMFVFPHRPVWILDKHGLGTGYEKAGWQEWQGDLGSLPPQSTTTYECPPRQIIEERAREMGIDVDVSSLGRPAAVDIAFVDSRGHAWARDDRGQFTGGRDIVVVIGRIRRAQARRVRRAAAPWRARRALRRLVLRLARRRQWVRAMEAFRRRRNF